MSDLVFCRNSRIWGQLTALAAVLLLSSSNALSNDTVTLQIGPASYRIELASTPEQRRQGLMHRRHLDPRRGMLLVYPDSGNHRIWMKNVPIPLAVYWIDADYRVIDVQRLEPCSMSPCPIYQVDEDSRYVLELGDYEHPLAPGDRVEGLRNL